MVRQAAPMNDMGFVGGLNIAQQSAAAMVLDLKFGAMPSLDLSTLHQPATATALSARHHAEPAATSLPPIGSKSARVGPGREAQPLPPALRMPLFSKQARMDEKIRGNKAAEPPAPLRPSGFPSMHAPSRRRIVIELNDADEPITGELPSPIDERADRREKPRRPPQRQRPDAPADGAAGAGEPGPSAAPNQRRGGPSHGMPLPPLVAASMKMPRRLQARLDTLRTDEEAQAAFEARMSEVLAALAPQEAARAAAFARLPHPLADASPAQKLAKRERMLAETRARQHEAAARREAAAAAKNQRGRAAESEAAGTVDFWAAGAPSFAPDAAEAVIQLVPSHDVPDAAADGGEAVASKGASPRSHRSSAFDSPRNRRPSKPKAKKQPTREEAAYLREIRETEKQAAEAAKQKEAQKEAPASSMSFFEPIAAPTGPKTGAARMRKNALAASLNKML